MISILLENIYQTPLENLIVMHFICCSKFYLYFHLTSKEINKKYVGIVRSWKLMCATQRNWSSWAFISCHIFMKTSLHLAASGAFLVNEPVYLN